MVMRLDLNVTDPSRNLYDLKVSIKNSCWLYLRSVAHFQLHQDPDVLLNSTAFNFKVGKKVVNVVRFENKGTEGASKVPGV